MNITVIGTGFVGVVTAGVFAHFNNRVFALDIDQTKIDNLSNGKIPFYEPDLSELVAKGLASKKLTFTTSYEKAVKNADVVILAVGTPSAPNGTADLKFIFAASASLAPYIKQNAVVVIKSTVPPGTNAKVETLIREKTKTKFFVASVPEFLKEGTAVSDTLNPNRIVIGSVDKRVIKILLELHKPLGGERIIVSPESAQMAKYAANAYLAQRTTFINQIANLCEKNGADVMEVISVIGADQRIGSHYWYPGLGYGGSCFPKDVKELAAYSRSIGEGNGLFVKLDDLNEERIEKLLKKWGKIIGGWQQKKVAILGLSFKPNTDDIREAPSTKIIPLLKKEKATIIAYDPKALPVAREKFPGIITAQSAYDCLKEVDVALLLVEWPELTQLNIHKVRQLMSGDWFIDTRNQYQPQAVEAAGLRYIGIGR